MVQFGWQRGSVEESLRTAIEVNSFEELCSLIANSMSEVEIGFVQSYLTIDYYGFDDGILEDVYIVTLDKYGVLGWLNGTFE